MGDSSVWLIVVASVVVIACAIVALVKLRAAKERRRVAAMSPAEREFHGATREYEENVKVAEKHLRQVRKAHESRLKSARKALENANSIPKKPLGSYKGVDGNIVLFGDRITVTQGTFDLDETVRATVDTAGNLIKTSRSTLTRMAAGGVLLGPVGILAGGMLKKGKTHEARELYLMVEGSSFATLVTCKPEDGPTVRQFATSINQAAKTVDTFRTQTRQAIEKATAGLKQAESDTAALEAAERELDVVRSNRSRIEAAARQLKELPR